MGISNREPIPDHDKQPPGVEGSPAPAAAPGPAPVCRLISWFSQGQSVVVEVDGIEVTIGMVACKGRRARIKVEAPGESTFRQG